MRLRNKKTSEVIDLDIANIKAQFGGISVIPEPVKLGGDEYVYYSLAELNDDWEDYVPAEPLIKDEKVRKAIRAWAEGSNFQSVHYDAFWTCFRRGNSSITVWEELPLEDNKAYTIDELCGEEEE